MEHRRPTETSCVGGRRPRGQTEAEAKTSKAAKQDGGAIVIGEPTSPAAAKMPASPTAAKTKALKQRATTSPRTRRRRARKPTTRTARGKSLLLSATMTTTPVSMTQSRRLGALTHNHPHREKSHTATWRAATMTASLALVTPVASRVRFFSSLRPRTHHTRASRPIVKLLPLRVFFPEIPVHFRTFVVLYPTWQFLPCSLFPPVPVHRAVSDYSARPTHRKRVLSHDRQ